MSTLQVALAIFVTSFTVWIVWATGMIIKLDRRTKPGKEFYNWYDTERWADDQPKR